MGSKSLRVKIDEVNLALSFPLGVPIDRALRGKSLLKRDIEKDIQNGHFVLFMPLVILTIVWQYFFEKDRIGLKGYLKQYFVASGEFHDGLFRFSYLCMYLFPLAGLGFYFTLAYLTSDPILYLTIFVGFCFMWLTAIYATVVEPKVTYQKKLWLAWLLGLETIASVLLIGFFSPAVVEFHCQIWLYMVLVGFTLVQTAKLGLSNAIFAASLPFIFSLRHAGEVSFPDFLQSFGLLGTYFLASICKLVSDNHAEKSARNEKLALNREAEISFLLNRLPQGLLTIGREGHILDNYSDHTLEILETSELSGQTIEQFTSGFKCSDDEKDQIVQAVKVILDDDSLNYEANSEKLPKELVYYNDKVLRLTWSPKFDANDDCESLLVTILDISEEKKSAASLEVEQQRVAMIFELISVKSMKRLHNQLRQAKASLHACQNEIKDLEVVTIAETVMMQLHTLKGNSRTLGLKQLASLSHQLEQEILDLKQSALRLGKTGVSTSFANVVSEKTQIALQKLEEYLQIYEQTLAGKQHIEIKWRGRPHLLSHDQIIGLFGSLEKLEHTSFDRALAQVLMTEEKTQLKEVILSFQNILNDTATKLEKTKPKLIIRVPSFELNDSQVNILNDCLVHLLNNHIDHGIEKSAERIQNGKKPCGEITIRANVDESYLFITTFDDGRGLDLNKIADGPVSDSSRVSDCFSRIFEPGFSTATWTSEISGRGVGLSAVRKAICDFGGDITIQPQGKIDCNGFIPIAFCLRFPLDESAKRITA